MHNQISARNTKKLLSGQEEEMKNRPKDPGFGTA
jgi:hypothetical protein